MMDINQKFAKTINYFKEAYFPSFCVNCGATDKMYLPYICINCHGGIKFNNSLVCYRCGKLSKNGQFCGLCRGHSELKGVLYATRYKEPISELVHYFKYNKMISIGQYLGDIMSKQLSAFAVSKDVILSAVPLNIWKKWQRGFNQSEYLAKIVSKKRHIVYIDCLKRVKATKSQMKLKRSERQENIVGAFKVKDSSKIFNKIVILIDDVCTTGATINECARVLKEAGAKEVWGLVLAKD